MVLIIIILIVGMLAAFVTGFYFGYLKQEKQPPNIIEGIMKSIVDLKDTVEDMKEVKIKNDSGFY